MSVENNGWYIQILGLPIGKLLSQYYSPKRKIVTYEDDVVEHSQWD